MIPDATLEITTMAMCKVMCDYCPQHQLIKAAKKLGIHASVDGPKMTFETFKTCLKTVPTSVWIDFAGYTECMLNPETPKMMNWAHKNGYTMRLYTTLTGATINMIKQIQSIPFNLIVLHLPDNHGILKTIVDDEYLSVLQYVDQNLKFKSHCFGELHQEINRFLREQKIRLPNLEYKSLSEHLITRANNTKNTSRVSIPERARNRGKIKCRPILEKGGSVYNHNVLLHNGDVQLCCCDYSLKHKLGNLMTDNYFDLFSSAEYRRVMDGQSDDTIDILCRTCENAIPV